MSGDEASDAALFDSLYAGREVVRGSSEAESSLIGRRLFVRGLPYGLAKPEIRRMLSEYGQVERVETWKARRGVCMVDYATAREASRCLTALDGKQGRVRLSANVERIFRDDGASDDEDDREEEEEEGPPLTFSGRGTRADAERQRMIERKFKKARLFCELCGRRGLHFAQGCFLADKTYHRQLVAGEVASPDRYAEDLVAERRAERDADRPQSPPPLPARATEGDTEVVAPTGRGRGVSLPAWMNNPDLKARAGDTTRPPPPERPVLPDRREVREVRDEKRRRREPDPAAEMRLLSSNFVVWPLEDDGLYVKYDYDLARLSLCRSLPSGTQVEADVTPTRDLSRAVDACRLDVAADPAAAVDRAFSLCAFDPRKNLPLPAKDLHDLRLKLRDIPDDLPALPDHISMHWNRDYLAYFYYDTNTGAVDWSRPTATDAPPRTRSRRAEDDPSSSRGAPPYHEQRRHRSPPPRRRDDRRSAFDERPPFDDSRRRHQHHHRREHHQQQQQQQRNNDYNNYRGRREPPSSRFSGPDHRGPRHPSRADAYGGGGGGADSHRDAGRAK